MDKPRLGLMPKKQMRPCFNYLSQSMDTHRQMPLVIVLILMHSHLHPHIHRRRAPQRAPAVSTLRLYNQLAAVICKTQNIITIAQSLLLAPNQSKCWPVINHYTTQLSARQGHAIPTFLLVPLAVGLG